MSPEQDRNVLPASRAGMGLSRAWLIWAEGKPTKKSMEAPDRDAAKEVIVRRRLYFLLPDVASARKMANDLLLARIEDRYMRFLAKRDTDLAEMHEAGIAQKSDMVHGAEAGLAVGGACGIVASIILMWSPPAGMDLELAVVLATTLGGALLGAWIGSLVGASVPNSRLKRFADDIERGRILLMIDVPRQRLDEIRELVTQRHPEAAAHGMEPTVPAFP